MSRKRNHEDKATAPTPPAHCTFDPEDWLLAGPLLGARMARACDIAGAPVKATLLESERLVYLSY